MFARRLAILSAIVIAAGPRPGQAQQSDVSISSFVSVPRSANARNLGGLGLTLAGSPGFALRATGHVALRNTYAGAPGAGTWMPAWGADVDAAFALSGRPFGSSNRSAASYAFLGFGTSARDTADLRLVSKNWSYGLGTMLPLGSFIDLFAESRWRMSRLVLPTATPKPARAKELRFGMSLHLSSTAISRRAAR